MSGERELLHRTADIAADFLESLDERPVFPATTLAELAAALGGPLPEEPSDPLAVVEAMARAVGPGLVATAGPRYFGYVVGGTLPATVAADWLTTAWDQPAAFGAMSPSASIAEQVVGDWLKELFGLPAHASFAITTGCQMAHVTALAAARHELLAAHGWDVRERGLAGSPPITVAVGEYRHATVDRALRLLGIGQRQIEVLAADGHGRMEPASLRKALAANEGPTIVVAQAGEVNTGSFDPLPEIVEIVRTTDAWLHVDSAFGLWVAASATRRHLLDGVSGADSWAADAHKWLNVPYDCGLAFCARPAAHVASMTMRADYYEGQGLWARDAADWTPESSRRARAFTVYAALRSLGRRGVADLVDRCCSHARRFAAAVSSLPGCEVLNDVVVNQVLFRFGDDETTNAVLAGVQESGEAWMGGTTWDGRAAIRLSVSGWRTTEQDIDRTVAAFADALGKLG
ncbi:MAG TPA: aminotransferase class V-fold PLP-dependent enzyme [Gaiellaceae bacterium]|nr:aminotransferase class V-fold PLP-dependent enzyme [Gaiellaceae bacterium]